MLLGISLGVKVQPEHKNTKPNKELIATRKEFIYLKGVFEQEAHDLLIREWDKFAATNARSVLEFNSYRMRSANQPSKISKKDRPEILDNYYCKLFKFMAHQNSIPAVKNVRRDFDAQNHKEQKDRRGTLRGRGRISMQDGCR